MIKQLGTRLALAIFLFAALGVGCSLGSNQAVRGESPHVSQKAAAAGPRCVTPEHSDGVRGAMHHDKAKVAKASNDCPEHAHRAVRGEMHHSQK
ncbi:MAG: hypothetical protein MJE77_10560 [Proteobacteria bacterium]|nr:hypothetical protein [Pseudomonadota bacterium]